MDEPRIEYGDTPEEIERAKFELPYKEWKIASIFLPDGRRYEVEFISLFRLSQDMQTMFETTSELYYDEPCLVVLHEVTEETIQQALNELYQRGYFDRLVVKPEKTWRLDPTWSERHKLRCEGTATIQMSVGARLYMEDKERAPLTIITPENRQYPIKVFSLLRLQQDMEQRLATTGQHYYADPGMIVMREVTEENVSYAVQALYEQGFFDQIVPKE